MKRLLFCIFVVLILTDGRAFAVDGRLVAVADDWAFTYASPDAVQFAISSMNWLTQNTTNKSILFDKAYYDDQLSDGVVINGLQNAGYSVTISRPEDWTPEILSQYGAVLWVLATPGVASNMLQYSQSGGNVLWVGGWVAPNQTESYILLNAYGISYRDPIQNGNNRTLTQFVDHPCVNGVHSLYTADPAFLGTLDNFNGTVVCSENGNDYIIAVPEPATLFLLTLGGLTVLRKKK